MRKRQRPQRLLKRGLVANGTGPSHNTAAPQVQDDRVFTTCPECGAELQAAVNIYLYGVEVNSAGLVIKIGQLMTLATNLIDRAKTEKPIPATKLDAARALNFLRGFIGKSQLHAIGQGCWGEERQYFYDKLVEMAGIVRTMPKTYEQDGLGDSAIAHLHYFKGSCDWYITEKDSEPDGQYQAFGLANLGYGGELGYISIVELIELDVELDLHFTPCTLAEIKARETH